MEEKPDVVPGWAGPLLALGWLLLLGGRWLIAPFLLAARLLDRAGLETLDRTLLLPTYLILLVITLVILALRAVRKTAPRP